MSRSCVSGTVDVTGCWRKVERQPFRHNLYYRTNGIECARHRPRPPPTRSLSPYDDASHRQLQDALAGQDRTASSRLPEYMELLERKAIEQAPQENRYNKTKTASALGITFRALRYKLKKLGID